MFHGFEGTTPLHLQNVRDLVTLPGMRTSHTLLNVVRSRGPGRVRDAVVIDNLEVKANAAASATAASNSDNSALKAGFVYAALCILI